MPDCQRAAETVASPVRLDAESVACLTALCARWCDRLGRFRRHAPPPWWAPGLILCPEIRAHYEAYLPVTEFLADLCRLGELVLPHPAWVPGLLRRGRTCVLPRPGLPGSLPDLWATLPETLAGRVSFAPEDLAALFCALADPPRFGTDAERYPAQQLRLREFLSQSHGERLALLDLACGVGLGTYEAAALAAQCGVHAAPVLGVTREPLEAWMASRRQLPHDPARERRLRQVADSAPPVAFLAADARYLPIRGHFHLVLCNGLVGGDALRRWEDVDALLAACERVLAPAGSVLLANRFHAGRRPAVEACAERARTRGWQIAGAWQDLALRRER
jgi:ubiquinone/menaquinone biosynthesis C-methylase UbiE